LPPLRTAVTRPPFARTPAVPLPEPVAGVLARHGGLADLTARLARSQACLALLHDDLPDGLRDAVRAGPIDDSGWSLLVANAAVAAKLRHLVPRLEASLQARGGPALPIRIRIRRFP
jgi:hypothetical protein